MRNAQIVSCALSRPIEPRQESVSSSLFATMRRTIRQTSGKMAMRASLIRSNSQMSADAVNKKE